MDNAQILNFLESSQENLEEIQEALEILRNDFDVQMQDDSKRVFNIQDYTQLNEMHVSALELASTIQNFIEKLNS